MPRREGGCECVGEGVEGGFVGSGLISLDGGQPLISITGYIRAVIAGMGKGLVAHWAIGTGAVRSTATRTRRSATTVVHCYSLVKRVRFKRIK